MRQCLPCGAVKIAGTKPYGCPKCGGVTVPIESDFDFDEDESDGWPGCDFCHSADLLHTCHWCGFTTCEYCGTYIDFSWCCPSCRGDEYLENEDADVDVDVDMSDDVSLECARCGEAKTFSYRLARMVCPACDEARYGDMP